MEEEFDDGEIELVANTTVELNALIDEKLKEGYLLVKGIEKNEDGQFVQIMQLSQNIDDEMTFASGIRLLLTLIFMGTFTYFYI